MSFPKGSSWMLSFILSHRRYLHEGCSCFLEDKTHADRVNESDAFRLKFEEALPGSMCDCEKR